MSVTLPSSKELFTLLQKKSESKCKFSLSCEKGHTKHIWISLIKTEAHLKLFYELMKRTLDSLIEKRYSDFDAQTTTVCCHGIALFARGLIKESLNLDLEEAKLFIEGKCKTHGKNFESFKKEIPSQISGTFIDLTSLYTLCFIAEKNDVIARKSVPKKLQELSDISVRFARSVTKHLQKFFSNFIADSYETYLNRLDKSFQINGAKVGLWGEYVKPKYIRKDQSGNKYVSCLFSMQISLSQMIQSNSILAIINDVVGRDDNNLIRREVYVCQGSQTKFKRVRIEDLEKLSSNAKEPVIVFGGCSVCDPFESKTSQIGLEGWIQNIPSLVLACDTRYPQFPRVTGDPNFNSDGIVPTDELLRKIIGNHSKIQGICSKDPSLFYLSHIFPASLEQISHINDQKNASSVPSYTIPTVALQ